MYALTDGTLYTGDQVLTGQAVLIDDRRIVDVVPQVHLPSDCEQRSVQGASVAPGFIDLQLNGCGGVMFNDAITAETLATMHATNLRSGTTHFLPTLITAPDEQMRAAIALAQAYQPDHPEILGLHLEGPYLNPKRKGIHNGAYVRSLDDAMWAALLTAGGDTVKILTLAPEQVPVEAIHQLADAGITVSAGHTDAQYEAAIAGFEAGITMATHLFNAMSPWQSRSPGMVGAIFQHPQVRAGIIADGHHVHFTSIALAKQIMGDRLFLVTDATPPAGAGVDSFMIGGQRVFYRDGKCVSAEGTLGGSALTMVEAIANCVHQADIPLAEALRMATLYPAEAIGMDHELGRIAPGYPASLVILGADLSVQSVIDQGRLHSFNKF
jgi:N-acetylglucosamine-6-phosphate deacetylase